MIVSFEFYVMNFVNFVVNCYLHITSHVSQAFASCTHNTSYSLLNIVHIIVCAYGLTNQVWNYFEYCLCKKYFVVEFLKGEWLKILILGKIGLKLVFRKSISSHTYAFIFLIFDALRCVFKNQVIFSKKMVFQIFDWSNLFFDQSKFLLKSFVSFCLFRLIETFFQSIEYRESGFLKMDFDFFKNTFSKVS